MLNIFYSISHSSPSEAESNTLHLKKSLGLFKNTPRIHAFGILGAVGPLDETHGSMVTDFATWIFLITHMRGYHKERSLWRTIRQINHLFPNDSVTFGDTGCDRLQFPLPSPFKTDFDGPEIAPRAFVIDSLCLLRRMAQKVKQGEILVLLLIGHGDVKDGKFQFLIITQPDKIEGKTFITKGDLENALNSCKGDVLVVCNSCYSGHLVSDRWTLLYSAAPQQTADTLAESSSGYVKGSAFTACLAAQATQEYGLRVPLPRAELRTTGPDLGLLRPSAPSHSFQLSALKPSNMSSKEFVSRMQNIEQLLVVNFPNIFQARGSKSTVSWTRTLPIDFTADAVERVGVKAASADYVTHCNPIAINEGAQGGPSIPTPESRLDPLLVTLATAMSEDIMIGPGCRTREMIYAKMCADLRRHIAEPQRYASPIQPDTISEESLLLVLRAIHVQAVAVQQIARVLGWSNADVVPFLPWTIGNGNTDKMIASGVRIDKLSWHLKVNHFQEYV